MPRISRRKQYIKRLRGYLKKRMGLRLLRMAWDELDDPLEESVDHLFAVALQKAQGSRYLFRIGYRKGNSEEWFKKDLYQPELKDTEDMDSNGDEELDNISCEEEGAAWLNDDEFLQKYRMSRSSFQKLLSKIQDHPVFHPPNAKKKQQPVAHQLMTFLKFIGTEGSGASNSNQRNTFRISRGAAEIYRRRCTLAIRSLSKDYIYWPSPEERKVIAKEIFQEYHFPHCGCFYC